MSISSLNKRNNYAIVTKQCEINLQTIVLESSKNEIQKLLITPGTLLKIIDSYGVNRINVQIMDYFDKNPIWENLYQCTSDHVKRVTDNLWPYLIAIVDPEERLQFALNQQHFKNILYLKIGDIVTVSGEPFRKKFLYDCIIRYIGLVPEIGPGYYFGLELLHLDNGYSPQSNDLPILINYMSCDLNLSLIVSANWINKIQKDQKLKFSPRELLCGTLDRAKSVLGIPNQRPTSISTSTPSSSSSSLRRSLRRQKSLDKQSSSKRSSPIYKEKLLSSSDVSINSVSNGWDDIEKNGKSVMEQKSHNRHSSTINTATITQPTINLNSSNNPSVSSSASSSVSIGVGSSNLKKNKATNTTFKPQSNENGSGAPKCSMAKDRCSTAASKDRPITTENIIGLDNEDYKRYVENYERNLERQHTSVSTITATNSIPPVSILKQTKNKKKPNIVINNSSISGCVKPTTIMSLEDRDIVVIDKADIKESTMNESEVIVLDKPRTQQKEVDLADILGSNWPTTAGDAAIVLNSDNNKSSIGGNSNINNNNYNNNMSSNTHVSSSSNSSVSSYNVRSERNKSGNPLSHMISTKAGDKRMKENVKIQTDMIGSSSGVSVECDTTGKNIEKKLKNTEQQQPIYDNANISSQILSLTPPSDEILAPSPLSEIPGKNLGVGSMVEVSTDVCEDLYGVIRWIGCPQGSKTVMVGVELEEELNDRPLTLTDGTNNGIRLFRCPNGRALFVHPTQCSKDRRFLDIELPQASVSRAPKLLDAKMFGQVECPPVAGAIAPLKILNLDELEAICGKFKGIQGHHNSCYLDATLFAMFTFTGVFDSLLFRPSEPEDISHYEEVQKVLREEIVNPLRKNIFVRADRVMKLRQLLEKLSSVSGLTSEEKDPEEFLNSLLAQIMRADPFLKLSSGQDTFFYQLFVEKDERLSFPSVQQLFEQSFLASDIKLKEVPSCLIIQMPRFGKNFKMYPRILPSQVLDVTDIIEDSPRQCSVCGKLAEYECRECFGILQCGVGLESTAFCKKCLETVHSHVKRANHTPKEISVPPDFKIMAEHLTVPRLFMELFAVVCIETSHYVAFVKAGSGLDSPWCFFDSMADRKGEQNGYNIPEMVSVPDLPQWLSEEGARIINEASSNDKMLPEHAKRLLCDAYMCMYQSTDVMMYR